MKLNNKGFTFVEILAVIVIIGLLTGLAIVGVSKYKEQAKNKDYEALAKSSYNAMEEYIMAHPYETKASLETLEKLHLLSNRKDPGSKENDCTGTVKTEKISQSLIFPKHFPIGKCFFYVPPVNLSKFPTLFRR